jgi:hypothetical protein
MLTTGSRIGPYVVGGSLGAGGMGEVYRARDVKLNREVAITCRPTFCDTTIVSRGSNAKCSSSPRSTTRTSRTSTGSTTRPVNPLVVVMNRFDQLTPRR